MKWQHQCPKRRQKRQHLQHLQLQRLVVNVRDFVQLIDGVGEYSLAQMAAPAVSAVAASAGEQTAAEQSRIPLVKSTLLQRHATSVWEGHPSSAAFASMLPMQSCYDEG